MIKSLLVTTLMFITGGVSACDNVCNSCVQQVVIPSHVQLVTSHDKYYVMVPQTEVVVQRVVVPQQVVVRERVRNVQNVQKVERVVKRNVERNVRVRSLREMLLGNRRVERVVVEKIQVHH
jgi:hypothetical protein